MSADEARRRWRLALGRYAETDLGGLDRKSSQMDRSLEFLYGREYQKRGLRHQSGRKESSARSLGSLDPTQMRALDWLGEAQALFPSSVFETLQAHALERYELSDLLKDPKTLEGLEPNQSLLKVLMRFHGRADPAVRDKLRAIADKVIQEIMERLRAEVRQAFSGRRNRFRRSNKPSAANFDWRATLRDNLKTYDPKTGRIIAERLRFYSRDRRQLTWQVILCVDQSGSMTDSLIHAAVMASILSGLPGVTVKMVLFDTSILDVSDKLDDPLETLLSVQLGGGTDIGRAVRYCETLVENPERTVFALVSDFAEGAGPRPLYAAIARLNEARVRMLGLLALDSEGTPFYDSTIAAKVSDLGMPVAAMSPDRFAKWLAEIIQ